MNSNIRALCRVISSNIIFVIILIIFQSIILVQVSSSIVPPNSVNVGQTLSKFTNIHSPIVSTHPSIASITQIHDNISSAYEISLEIFLNKELKNNCSLPALIYNNGDNISKNISKADEVTLEIFLNKKIKAKTKGSHSQDHNVKGEINDGPNAPIDSDQDTESEDYMISAFEKTTQIIRNYTQEGPT